jgi:hypothetical protein
VAAPGYSSSMLRARWSSLPAISLSACSIVLVCSLCAAACGARSALEEPPPLDAAAPEAPPTLDAGLPCPGGGRPPSDGGACGPLSFHLGLEEACTISLIDCAPIDAEGFAMAVPWDCALEGYPTGPWSSYRVFAMNRMGRGHVLGFCDSTVLTELVVKMDAFGYLGQTAFPRVASLGGGYPCGDGGIDGVTFLGETLPAKYGDAAALAADWDAIVLCGANESFAKLDPAWAPLLVSFVRDLGRGLLAALDYTCSGKAHHPNFEIMNSIVSQAGFTFDIDDIYTGHLSVDLPCVTDLPAP